jgi:hypothetical protein
MVPAVQEDCLQPVNPAGLLATAATTAAVAAVTTQQLTRKLETALSASSGAQAAHFHQLTRVTSNTGGTNQAYCQAT